ncbi:MAG TPA: hypothetical protein VHA33_05600 [Candidatus Angelobacter sp.]|jgi:hypothetical protein|nr:hypothetical protein [Candidatus Angelobacter sp.]
MQTLGISDSTPDTESRLKSLFWPSIKTGSDVDYLGRQGFWVCAVVAVIASIFLVIADRPFFAVLVLLFYYLGGVGVRERSRYAATIIFVMYFIDTVFLGAALLSAGGVIRIILLGLLLSNLRATWVASGWRPGSEDATLPPRLADTWGDKLSDQLPMWLWPKIRIFYYIFSGCFLAFMALGLITILSRSID